MRAGDESDEIGPDPAVDWTGTPIATAQACPWSRRFPTRSLRLPYGSLTIPLRGPPHALLSSVSSVRRRGDSNHATRTQNPSSSFPS